MLEELDDDARGHALVQVLAFVLERMIDTNNNQLAEEYPATKFQAKRPPGINIKDYLLRINKYAACSPECLVLSLVYIDRLIERNRFVLTELNVHRVTITSIVLAAKFFDDQYYNNSYYAKVGGIPCNEMNSLELEFLFLINFSLHVSAEDFSKYYNELANHFVFSNSLVTYFCLPKHAHHIEHYITYPTLDQKELVYVTNAVLNGDRRDRLEEGVICNNYEHSSSTNDREVLPLGVNA